jgi:hypothetical protein
MPPDWNLQLRRNATQAKHEAWLMDRSEQLESVGRLKNNRWLEQAEGEKAQDDRAASPTRSPVTSRR